MDNKSNLVLFFVFIVVLIFSFTLSLDAISNNQVLYGVYAFVGFFILMLLSFFQGATLKKEGVSLSYWFSIMALVSLIVQVWYVTRAGTLFGWW